MTLGEILRQAKQHLVSAGIPDPDLDVRLLCKAATGFNRSQQFLRLEDEWEDQTLLIFRHLIERRAKREPVGRILGEREFWGMPFKLSPATLEPRPDSETLIEAALHHKPDLQSVQKILDLGTGTGCLLAALLKEYPDAEGLAIDQSEEAVATASANLERLGFAARAKVQTGHWADGVTERFDIVISNPPYIGVSEELSPEVREHDPAAALFAGADGLEAYRALVPTLAALLTENGLAVLEVGYLQSQIVADMGRAAGLNCLEIRADLNGHPRAVLFSH